MKIKLILLLVLLSIPALAQDAKVRQLSEKDAAQAKRLYEEYQTAEKRWTEYRDDVEKRYVKREGWQGFKFSEDFRFIVPAFVLVNSGAVIFRSDTTTPCFSQPSFTSPGTATILNSSGMTVPK